MKTAFVLIAICGVSAAAPVLAQSLGLGPHAPSRSRQQGSIESENHPDINQGRFIAFHGEFGTLRVGCSQCHQIDGTADPSGAFPRLAGQSAWYLYSTMRDFADGKRPSDVMGPIARQLTDGQMQDVAGYYATVGPQPFPPRFGQDPQAVKQGESIAQSGAAKAGIPACDSCHGQKGVGNPPLYPVLAGQSSGYLQSQLQQFKSGKRGGDPMHVMQSIADRMKGDQMRAVAEYYASLSPNEVAPGGLKVKSRPRTMNNAALRTPTARATAASDSASNAEDVQHLGATKAPHPGGPAVVPVSAPPKH